MSVQMSRKHARGLATRRPGVAEAKGQGVGVECVPELRRVGKDERKRSNDFPHCCRSAIIIHLSILDMAAIGKTTKYEATATAPVNIAVIK